MRKTAFLALDEINPQVELASYFENEQDVWYKYANPGHHLLMATRGRIEALTQEERIVAMPGELLCFRPANLNQYGTFAVTHFFQIHLSLAPPPRHLQPLWLDGIGPLPTHMKLGNRRARVQELLETVCLAIESTQVSDRLRVRAAVEEILALAIEACSTDDFEQSRADPWQLVRQRLERDLQRDIPISRLARDMDISTDHFIRQFKDRFGISPKRYRILMRLRWAAHSLRSGAETIKSIAAAIGFSDTTSFTRLFRRHFGVVPSAMIMQSPQAIDCIGNSSRNGIVMNRHLVRPHSPPDWEDKFRLNL